MLRVFQLQGQAAYEPGAKDIERSASHGSVSDTVNREIVPAGTGIKTFQIQAQVAYFPRAKRVSYRQASPWGGLNQSKYKLVEKWR